LNEKQIQCEAHKLDNLAEALSDYDDKMKLAKQIRLLKRDLEKTESLLQLDELKARRRVLRRLQYTSESDLILVKGRVACEISAGDELILTEMIFNGDFNNLSTEQINALLSCFTFSESSKQDLNLQPELDKAYKLLRKTALMVGNVQFESKLDIKVDDYVDSFKADMMGVVYAWSLGAKFSQICKLTDIFEGSIIRAMRRQEELLRQLIAAARGIGNSELEERFEKCNI
jgi:ATP-dependent RNA helicase DOB1